MPPCKDLIYNRSVRLEQSRPEFHAMLRKDEGGGFRIKEGIIHLFCIAVNGEAKSFHNSNNLFYNLFGGFKCNRRE